MFTEGTSHVWTADHVLESPTLEVAEWSFAFVVSDAVPRSAGRMVNLRGVSVFQVEGGRCRRYREYFDRGAALVQVGLDPAALYRVLSRPARPVNTGGATAGRR